MAFKSFEVAFDVIEEANKRFEPAFKPDDEKLSIFKEYCESIDVLVEEFDGESLEVEVDENKMTICIQLECTEITIESRNHRLYDLIQRSVSCGFFATKNNTVVLKLVFPSIWDKAK